MGNPKHVREYKRLNGELCIYCGERSTTIDHFPPKKIAYTGWLLPACKECNCIAGTEYPFDLEKRLEYVKSRLKRRYKKHLKIPNWDCEEIEILGNTLASAVKEAIERKLSIQNRLVWDGKVYFSSLLGIDEILDPTD